MVAVSPSQVATGALMLGGAGVGFTVTVMGVLLLAQLPLLSST